MIFNEAIGRVVKAKTHVRPFYYYWSQLPLLIFPYGILFFSVLYLAIKKLNFYTYWTKLEKISFIWTIVPLIILSCASGKLSIYLLPIFPAIIIFIFEISSNNQENKIEVQDNKIKEQDEKIKNLEEKLNRLLKTK